VNQVSKIIGLDGKQINAELNKRLRQAQRTASYNAENQKGRTVDYGQGLFATAQREVLEVLLNEPKLFEIVKQKITADLFDVPILRQIAAIMFETLNTNIDASLAEMLAKTESVELGSSLVELTQGGEEKGNFKARLTGALNAIDRYQAQKSRIETIEDPSQFLRKVYENTGKENPHNVGMV